MKATQKDIELISAAYDGRTVFHGDLHNHADTGGTSDGKRSLEHWKGALEALHMDFAAILDHRQVRHMYLPEWEDGLFICGSEPGTEIIDIDPANAYYNADAVNVVSLMFETLFTLNDDGKVKKALVDDYDFYVDQRTGEHYMELTLKETYLLFSTLNRYQDSFG